MPDFDSTWPSQPGSAKKTQAAAPKEGGEKKGGATGRVRELHRERQTSERGETLGA